MSPADIHQFITFVVVNYKTAHLLPECLQSIRAAAGAAGAAHEIAVVENTATPAEAEAIRALAADRVIFSDENLGFGGACNRAIAETAGDFVWLVNPDARLAEGCVAAVLDAFRRAPSLAAASPPIVGADGRPQRAAQADPSPANYWRHYSVLSDFRRSSGSPGSADWLIGAALCLRRASLDALGRPPFDPRFFLYFEDADLCRSLRDAGAQVALVDSAAPAVHAAQQSSGADPETKQRTLIEFFRSFLRYGDKWFAPDDRRSLHSAIARDMQLRLLSLPMRLSLSRAERDARRRAYQEIQRIAAAPDR